MIGVEVRERGIPALIDRWCSPFTCPVPPAVREPLIRRQADRLHAALPLLCLAIAANAVAMGLAVWGDLPAWQQLGPPLIIAGTCLIALARSRWRRQASVADAAHQLRGALFIAAALGLIAGIWCVNAFNETEQYYCMVAPVFIGIAALVSATCLLSVPRAAIVGMAATVAPIVVKMALYENLGVRAMAAMMVVTVAMQSAVILGKFRETVRTLALQDELNRLAETDSLTGLENRLAFLRALQGRLGAGRPLLVAMIDLDGFKLANDTHGHHAGDEALIEIARRMTAEAPSACSIARLGGDEFALLFELPDDRGRLREEIAAIRAAVARPIVCGGATIIISASIGLALSPDDGIESAALLRTADLALYAEKRLRRVVVPLRLAG